MFFHLTTGWNQMKEAKLGSERKEKIENDKESNGLIQ